MQQPNEAAAASLRLAGPGLGLGLNAADTDAYLAAAYAGVIEVEGKCDKGMQDNFALRSEISTALSQPA